MKAQHVEHAHRCDASAEKLRPLRQAGADEQPAVAAAANCELRRPGIALPDQPFGYCDEVVEDVLFVGLHPGLVPGGAVLAAATQANLREQAAHLHPDQVGYRKGRGEGNVEASIAIEVRWIVAITLEPTPVAQKDRHARSVFAWNEDLHGRIRRRVEVQPWRTKDGVLPSVKIVTVDHAWHREVGEKVEALAILTPSTEALHRA